jgi:aminoglycoside phosphotransferase (APT) family kinase protein
MEKYNSNEIYYFNAHRSSEDVLALQKRYKMFMEKYGSKVVVEIIEKILNTKVLKIKQDGNFGTGHVIFFVETEKGEFVFRANVGVLESEFYMDLEKDFNKIYEHANIPVGKVLYSDTSRNVYDFDFQIMEVLPGKDLETEWAGIQEDYDKISFELGQIVARQYKAPVKGWGRFLNQKDLQGTKENAFEYLIAYLNYDLEVILKAGILSEIQVAEIRNFFAKSKFIFDNLDQSYLVHHDLADHNIRYFEDRIVAIFDWENAVAFDPVSELGSAPTWVCHYSRKEKMIQGFIFEMKELGLVIPEFFEEKIAIYSLRTMIWKVAFRVKGNNLPQRHLLFLKQALQDCGLDIKFKI